VIDVNYALTLQRQGKVHDAKIIYLGLTALNPKDFHAQFYLALIYFGEEDFDRAIKCLQKAVKLNPEHIGAWNNLRVVYKKRGRYQEALMAYQKVLNIDAKNADAHNNLSNLCLELQKPDIALRYAKQGLQYHPESANLWLNYGLAQFALKEYTRTEEAFLRALKLKPDLLKARIKLGQLYYTRNHFKPAIQQFEKVVKAQPKNGEGLYNLGLALYMDKNYDASITVYQQLIKNEPNHSGALNNLAIALQHLDRHEEALPLCERAIALRPDDSNLYNTLGSSLRFFNRLDEAETCFKKTLTDDPKHANAHCNQAWIDLVKGRLTEGWEHYEWRWQHADSRKKITHLAPDWNGEPLEGKTILLYREQGFGDSIQFIRYASMVKARGAARLVAECKPPLKPLLKAIGAIDDIVTDLRDPKNPSYDYAISLLSLPRIFDTTLENVPNTVPYLHSMGKPVKFKHSPKKVNIGVFWSGSNTHRNHAERIIDLKYFEPLLDIQGTQFFSLQVRDDCDMIERYGYQDKIIDLADKLTDFNQTASVIEQLDLVIGSDTSVVHLAGALAKPCWVCIPYLSDWRWILEREDSPWYPTMTVFRKSYAGDWAEVMGRVHQRLQGFVANFTRE
jgi:tetratricopeptide (TPR) repeat protein